MTSGNNGPTWSAVANWTRTWSANLVTDNRFSYSLIGIDDKVIDWSGLLGADGNSKFGIPGGQFIPGLSSFNIGGGLTGAGNGGHHRQHPRQQVPIPVQQHLPGRCAHPEVRRSA